MDIVEKIKNLDRRIIFLMMFLAVAVPIIIPIGLPVQPSPIVERGYNAVENLSSDSVVLVSFDFDPSAEPELYPMGVAILKHLMRKRANIITMALWPAGAKLAEDALREATAFMQETEDWTPVYGIDYANIGFMAGGMIVITSIGKSLPRTFPTDFYRRPTSELPIMRGIENYSNIDMVVTLSAGDPGVPFWVMVAATSYGKPLIAGCTAVSAPQLYPYQQSGQLVSLIGGLKGAAEYEALADIEGRGTRGMDSQSIAHLVIVIMIIIGNITFFIEKRRLKKLKSKSRA